MKVYELLDSPKRWIKGAYARDAGDDRTSPTGPLARCWCLGGAIAVCYRGLDEQIKVRRRVIEATGFPVECFNDNPNTTFKKVVDLCERLDI